MNKKIIKIFIMTLIILSIANTFRVQNMISSYINIQDKNVETDLHIIVSDMKNMSKLIFDNIINRSEVIDIFKQAHTATEDEKNKLRTSLYDLLKQKYENMKDYDIQQLHFHLPNNESFLRFHKPEKFGDNLSNVRASVKYVNEHKKPISGFEEGKIYNGYRFVYPLFDDEQNHIGSVEVSASLLSFKKQYELHSKRHIDYILKEDIIHKKLFNSEFNNYVPYHGLKNFLIQTSLKEYNDKYCLHIKDIATIFEDENMQEKVKLFDKYVFTKWLNLNYFTAHFIPFMNDFTQEVVGYKIIYNEVEFFSIFLKGISKN